MTAPGDSCPEQAQDPGQDLQTDTSFHPGLSRGGEGDTQKEGRRGLGEVFQAKAAEEQGISETRLSGS